MSLREGSRRETTLLLWGERPRRGRAAGGGRRGPGRRARGAGAGRSRALRPPHAAGLPGRVSPGCARGAVLPGGSPRLPVLAPARSWAPPTPRASCLLVLAPASRCGGCSWGRRAARARGVVLAESFSLQVSKVKKKILTNWNSQGLGVQPENDLLL